MFLNAIMLAGIGAAVIPIVLHLLSRARYRTIEWGAMMFLGDATAKLKNRSRLAQWLLLALRVAAIALLAIALARPVLRRAAGPIGGRGLAVAIVVDGSPSMLHPEQNATRFELARKAALGVLSDLHPGDEAALIELGAPYSTDVPPTTDLQRVASRLASLEPAHASADLADGIRRAQTLLADRADVPREVYLFADRQRSTWQSLDRMPRDRSLHITAVPVGSTENRNVAVESIELLDPPAVAGQPMRVRVKVHNWSIESRGGLTMSLGAGYPLDRATLNLASGATEQITRTITLSRVGPAVLSAAISPSGMPADDSASVSIDVVDPIRVLVISGEPPGALRQVPTPSFSGACDFLALALDPYTDPQRKKPSPFRVQFASDITRPRPDPKQDRVVVLADAAKLDDDGIRALEQFVFAGGGLLLAPGNNTSPEWWNRHLLKDGAGLAPAPIIDLQSTPTSLVGVQTGSPVFAFFGSTASTLPSVNVLRWVKFAPRGDVLASLRSGDPFLLESTFGRGRVIAMAGPVDASWSNLPLTRLYLPMMQSIVRRLASATTADRNVNVGSPLEATIPSPTKNTVDIYRPDGRSDRAPVSVVAGVGNVVYNATDVPGRYVMRLQNTTDLPFIVRQPAGESDLSLQDDPALKPIANSAGVELASDGKPLIVGASRKASEWSIPLILLTIVALAVEATLTARLSVPAGER